LPLFLRPSTRGTQPCNCPANSGGQEATVEDFAGALEWSASKEDKVNSSEKKKTAEKI
jgi:hypothetical protein